MHQAWSDAVGEYIETVGVVASGSEEVLEGLPTRLGASRNYVSEPISAFNCTQHTGPGIWETLLIVPDLVSLLTLPTMRILEELPRLSASRNYVSEPISAFNCTQHTGPGIWETLLIVPDLVSLLTLPTMRILEELPRLSAYHNYVSEPIPAYNCILGSGTLLVVLDLVECIDSSP